MRPAERTQPVRQGEVVDNPNPKLIGQVEAVHTHPGQPLEIQKRNRRQNQRPDLLKIAKAELEGLQHGSCIRSVSVRRRGYSNTQGFHWLRTPDPLPER